MIIPICLTLIIRLCPVSAIAFNDMFLFGQIDNQPDPKLLGRHICGLCKPMLDDMSRDQVTIFS